MKFNVGDWVWWAKCGSVQVSKTCPICYGKMKVTLILGNRDTVILPCDYCGKGYQGPKGFIHEHEYKADPQKVQVSHVEISQTAKGEERHYRYDDHYGLNEDVVFETYDKALEKCKEVKAKLEKDQETRAGYIKKDVNKTYAWNAGYHLREVKRIEESIAYHKRMAVFCKAKIKKGGDK